MFHSIGALAKHASLISLVHVLVFFALQGWGLAASQVAMVWVNDIVRYQLHRYVAGVQPIRSISNVHFL